MSDKYLDPPEEPEAQFCEDCGKEMVEGNWYQGRGLKLENLHCPNRYCPAKHTGIAQELAGELLRSEEITERLEVRVKWFLARVRFLEELVERLEKNKNA